MNPIPSVANSLFTFMAQRFVASYQLLNCETLIGKDDPITVVTDPTTGIATNASLNQMLYSTEVSDLESTKAADDAADAASKSLLTKE
jgi:hypothetical protein